MKVYKQNSGDQRCVAMIAAMVTDTEPKEFELYVGGEAPYSDYDFCKYLFEKGFICGFGIDKEAFQRKIDVSDSNDREDCLKIQRELTQDSIIKLEFKLKDFWAYIVVESEIGENEHAILYADGKVYDPSPFVGSEKSINDYKIIRYYPIIRVDE